MFHVTWMDFFRFTGGRRGERKNPSSKLENEHLDLFEEFLGQSEGSGALKTEVGPRRSMGETEICGAWGKMYGSGGALDGGEDH
jgi:hypothetical protein